MSKVKLDTRVLDSLIASNPERASQIVRETAFEVQGKAAAAAPVDTGNLRNTIQAKEHDGPLNWRVSDGTEYGIYQELGFNHWRSGAFVQNAFMVPAVEASRENWRKRWRNFLRGK